MHAYTSRSSERLVGQRVYVFTHPSPFFYISLKYNIIDRVGVYYFVIFSAGCSNIFGKKFNLI
jgi:hypothetical protein